MAKILVLWQADYPWDVRIDKMVRSLTAGGISVAVVANNNRSLPQHDEYLGARVIRARRRITPLPGSPEWTQLVDAAVEKEQPDLVMVRDLPLYQVGHWVARRHKLPLWFDMAEDYPATFLDMHRSFLETIITKNYLLARLYERFAFRTADVISVVCEESRERLIRAGVPDSRVNVLENVPDAHFLSRYSGPVQPRRCGPLSLVFSGNLGQKRGIETVIDALQMVNRNGTVAELVVAGGSKVDVERLRVYATQRGQEATVSFFGMIDYVDLANVIAKADWGIVPHLNTQHIRTTLPNKLYDYMAVGTPVIVSDVQPLLRVVSRTGAGVAFRAGDAGDLARCLTEVSRHPELRQCASERSLEAYGHFYNWELEQQKMFTLVGPFIG